MATANSTALNTHSESGHSDQLNGFPVLAKGSFLAKKFQLDPSTLRALWKRGKIKGFRTNGINTGKLLYDVSSVISFFGIDLKEGKKTEGAKNPAILVRKSNPDSASIERQYQEVKDFADKIEGTDAQYHEFKENGISGMNTDISPQGARKKLGELWGLIAQGKISTVYVRTSDRLFRYPGVLSFFSQHCSFHKTKIVFTHPDDHGVDDQELKTDIDLLFGVFHSISMKNVSRRAARAKRVNIPPDVGDWLLKQRAMGLTIDQLIELAREEKKQGEKHNGDRVPLSKQVIWTFLNRQGTQKVSLESQSLVSNAIARETIISDFLKTHTTISKHFDREKSAGSYDIFQSFKIWCSEQNLHATSKGVFGKIVKGIYKEVVYRKIDLTLEKNLSYPLGFYLIGNGCLDLKKRKRIV